MKVEVTLSPRRAPIARVLALLALGACAGACGGGSEIGPETTGAGGIGADTGGTGGAGRGGSGGGGPAAGGQSGVDAGMATGVAGASGTGGSAGDAGIGDAGSAGAAGTSGAGGQGGGAAGQGGAAGGAGQGGAAGGAGQGGAAGGAGQGGAAGGAGQGGAAGAEYMPCPTTAGTACAVLPLGDSITEGFLPTGSTGGYRVELFSQAVLAGKNITFVGSLTSANAPNTVQNRTFPKRHEGHDANTIDPGSAFGGISGPVTDQAIATYRPQVVLLMIGTNDINGNLDVANAPARLGRLIDEITNDAPAALLVVASIIPIASAVNSRVQTYNAAIPGLVSTRAAAGKHVIFVDNYAAFVRDPTYQTSLMSDTLHPNAAGYAVLGRSFYTALGPHLP